MTQTRKYRFTLAEDDPTYLFLLHTHIGGSFPGCSIASFSTAEEALRHILHAGTDMLITDHGMGEMTGTELVLELRKRRFQTPIIVISGDSAVEKEARLAGANVFLEKKPHCKELEAHMRRLLSTVEIESGQKG